MDYVPAVYLKHRIQHYILTECKNEWSEKSGSTGLYHFNYFESALQLPFKLRISTNKFITNYQTNIFTRKMGISVS